MHTPRSTHGLFEPVLGKKHEQFPVDDVPPPEIAVPKFEQIPVRLVCCHHLLQDDEPLPESTTPRNGFFPLLRH